MAGSSAQVPKQLYGYSLQFTECVSALIAAPSGSIASIEVFEDVGIKSDDSGTQAIQVKAGSGINPISDGSLDLWKTFRNWIDQCNSLQLNPKNTRFTIYVNSKHKGKLCTQMSASVVATEIASAVASVSSHFFDKRTKKLRTKLGVEITKQLHVILDPLNAELLTLIIQNFSHRSGSGSAHEDLLQKFKQSPIKAGVIEDAMIYIAGWVQTAINKCIELDQPAIIHRDEFWKTLTTFCEKATQQPYLVRMSRPPTQEEIDAQQHSVFVKQLQLIELNNEQQIEAVTDYLTAKADAIIYLHEGVLNESSLTEFASDLVRRWKLQKLAADANGTTTTPVNAGKSLLAKCLLQDILLQGASTPGGFTAGCYHELADKKTVGWHPDYTGLL